MKKLNTKLVGLLRRLCGGRQRRRHSDDDDGAKCTFKQQQRRVNRKIHPSTSLVEPKDGGINDMKNTSYNTKEKEINGPSGGVELFLEPNSEKEIKFTGPSRVVLLNEPKEVAGSSGFELLLEPDPGKENTGPLRVEPLLEPNPENEFIGPSGIELLVEPNPEKEIIRPSEIEQLLEPNLKKDITGPSETQLEPNPEKEIIEPSGNELLLEPNLKKEITRPSGTQLEPNPEKEIVEPSGNELILEPNLKKEIIGPLGTELEPNPEKDIIEPSGTDLLVDPNLEKEITGTSGVEQLLKPNVEKEIIGPSEIELEPNPEEEITGPSGIELLHEPNPEKEFTYQDLQMLTDNFAREISSNYFGKLYAGRIPDGWKGMEGQDVTIKMWNHDTGYRSVNWDTLISRDKPNDALNRMASEINILSLPEMESHPSLPTVKGYCFKEKKLGVVYGIEPKRTLRAVIGHGSFTWARRIKLALRLAHLLEFLHRHQPQFLVRNLAASHIMLDKDWNPILVDCSMLVGGGFGDTRKAGKGDPLGSHGYGDVFLCFSYEWTEKSDVYAYGMILLELLFKRRFDAKFFRGGYLDCIARGLYRKFAEKIGESNFSFTLITNLGADSKFVFSDGAMLSKLAFQCVNFERDPRPMMTEIIEELEKLQVLKKIAKVSK